MNLESLNLSKFKESTLKKEQMFMLNGNGTKTGGGRIEGEHNGKPAIFDYGYDSARSTGVITYHDRSNIKYLD